MLIRAPFAARKFASGYHEPPLKGLYFRVWISRLKTSLQVQSLPFIRNVAKFSRTCSRISDHNLSLLVDSRIKYVFDWKFCVSTTLCASAVGKLCFMSALKTILTFVCGLNVWRPFCFAAFKKLSGSNVVLFNCLIVWCVVKPFRALLLFSSKINFIGNKLTTFSWRHHQKHCWLLFSQVLEQIAIASCPIYSVFVLHPLSLTPEAVERNVLDEVVVGLFLDYHYPADFYYYFYFSCNFHHFQLIFW